MGSTVGIERPLKKRRRANGPFLIQERSGPLKNAQACLNAGARLARKASMPSFWSAVAKSEWKMRRS